MDVQKLIDEVVAERISQIIQQIESDAGSDFGKEQEAILESLDEENREKFETLMDSLVALEAERCHKVYKAAFLDGLLLGHKAF